MRRFCMTLVMFLLATLILGAAQNQQFEGNKIQSPSQETRGPEGLKPDLSQQPTLYVVGYAHLDTEWRWEYPQVIDEYLRKTMEQNFALF